MWLDELQRYLDGEQGLTGGVVRALLNTPDPAVIIGTLWPDRARAAAARDRRLQIALDTAGYGLTQTLAAAPQLVARWEDAQTADPYAWAVLTAALDAARLGARTPLSADFLCGHARADFTSPCTRQDELADGPWAHPAMVRERRVSTAVSNGRVLRCTWARRSPPWSVASRVTARSSGSRLGGSCPPT